MKSLVMAAVVLTSLGSLSALPVPTTPSADETFSIVGRPDLGVGDVVDDGARVPQSGRRAGSESKNGDLTQAVVTSASASPVAYSWRDVTGRTVNLRSNVHAKIVSKHNVTWRVARAVTQYPETSQYGVRTRTDGEYRTPVHEIQCTGALWWRKCRVVRTVSLFARVDFRTDTSDRRGYGVVTTYCEGMTACPDFVKNALNI